MRSPLKIERENRGWTLAYIAAKVGASDAQISRIENGQNRPRHALVNELVALFENSLTRDQILFPEDYPETARRKPARRAAELQEAV